MSQSLSGKTALMTGALRGVVSATHPDMTLSDGPGGVTA